MPPNFTRFTVTEVCYTGVADFNLVHDVEDLADFDEGGGDDFAFEDGHQPPPAPIPAEGWANEAMTALSSSTPPSHTRTQIRELKKGEGQQRDGGGASRTARGVELGVAGPAGCKEGCGGM